jgi:hypothetical protein
MSARDALIKRRAFRLTLIGTTIVACLLLPSHANAGTLSLNINPYVNGCGVFTFNDPSHFLAPCSGINPMGVFGGTPWGATPGGGAYWAETVAPPGVTIEYATITGANILNVNNGQGWGGGSFFAGGGSQWYNGQGTEYDGPFSSSYWGFQIICGWSSCSNPANIYAGGIQLTAVENGGPSIVATGDNNLWYQTRPNEYVWNPSGDVWPISFDASDSSGVCSMSAYVGGITKEGPASVPDTSQWQQCPDRAWEPTQGASVDTRDYVSGSGSLALTLNAANAAGVQSNYGPEHINVDNDPVGVSFGTPNDANPSTWVGHAVIVDATATAGPSGVGGMRCSSNGGAASAYPAAGMAVNGDGLQTVSCTAWNTAVDPQGQPNTATNSMTVHIDEAPPSISFEPQNPSDPTGLVVDTSDSESGVEGGSLQIAPAGSSAWSSMPTSFDGAHLLGHFDDAGLRGPYVIRATSCDNVGNCASATETLTMPLRLAAASDVGFTKIGSPAQVVEKRVLVDYRHKRERRHGRIVRVRVGGHYRIVRLVIRANTRCGHKLVKTGPQRWREISVCRQLGLRVVTSTRVPYGKPFTVHGLLITTQGVPVASVPVSILTAPENGLDQFAQVASATTDSTGAWSATLSPGPSRIIRAVYGGSATLLPAAGQATVTVPAHITLTASPRQVPWDGTVTLRGHLTDGYVPPDGVALRLLIRLPHRSSPYEPIPFRTNSQGDFVVRWNWGTGFGVVTYPFAVATTATESDYPFAASRSRWIPVTFGLASPRRRPPPHGHQRARRRA